MCQPITAFFEIIFSKIDNSFSVAYDHVDIVEWNLGGFRRGIRIRGIV